MKNVGIVLYTTDYCPYCTQAKRFLKNLNLEFQEIDLGSDPDLRDKLSTENNWRTVPMIFIDGKFIGGFTDLVLLLRST